MEDIICRGSGALTGICVGIMLAPNICNCYQQWAMVIEVQSPWQSHEPPFNPAMAKQTPQPGVLIQLLSCLAEACAQRCEGPHGADPLIPDGVKYGHEGLKFMSLLYHAVWSAQLLLVVRARSSPLTALIAAM